MMKSTGTPLFFSLQERMSDPGKAGFQSVSGPGSKLSTFDLLARNKAGPFSGVSLANVVAHED
jgi:hypothetical protein